jgi:hypothetical protein
MTAKPATPKQQHRKEYRAWLKMLSRCYDEADERYHRYGGRGIRVCEEWWPSPNGGGFEQFLADMGPAPTLLHTLGRADNDLGYHPQNCRWETWKEQAQNRSTSCKLTLGKKTATMAQWAEGLGVSRKVLWKRIHILGWPIEDVLTTGLNGRRAA